MEQNLDMAPRAAVGDPLRFHGESFLLIGSSTYSQMKRAGIVPDVLIPDDPANPRVMIDEVLKTTEARR